MPRAPKRGDVATKARKRYYRAAERYLKKAGETAGVTSERFKQLAKQNFENALETYSPLNRQKYSKPISELAGKLGVNLQERRAELQALPAEQRLGELTRRKSRQKARIETSKMALESSMADPEERRQEEARALLNNEMIGSRIMGGLVDVWRDAATVVKDGQTVVDPDKIMPALYDYFGVNNLADILDKLEAHVGSALYGAGGAEVYEVIKLTIQRMVAENVFVV